MTHGDVGLLIQSGHFGSPTLIGKRWLSLFLDGAIMEASVPTRAWGAVTLGNTDPAT
jgi:hypothetical protein